MAERTALMAKLGPSELLLYCAFCKTFDTHKPSEHVVAALKKKKEVLFTHHVCQRHMQLQT